MTTLMYPGESAQWKGECSWVRERGVARKESNRERNSAKERAIERNVAIGVGGWM